MHQVFMPDEDCSTLRSVNDLLEITFGDQLLPREAQSPGKSLKGIAG
jgi:hypothetical protein